MSRLDTVGKKQLHHLVVGLGCLLLITGLLTSCGQEATPTQETQQSSQAETTETDKVETTKTASSTNPNESGPFSLASADTEVQNVVEKFDLDLENPGEPTDEITLVGHKLKFNENLFVAKKGQPVTVNLKNDGFVTHSFAVPDFDVRIDPIQPNNTTSTSFTPDEVGLYWFYCDVAEHKKAGMEGVMMVVE